MKFLALTLLALAGLPAPSTASQEKITLAQVLARAGAYVDEFQRQLSSIVAEETYLQEVAPAAGSTVGQNRRALRSDLLLLRPERSLTWVQYRDVFEVDGSPVLDRGERITSQSFNATALTAERVNRIRSESARYNIGDIERTLNVPVLPLVILSRRVQPQFRFKVDAAGGTPPRGAETTRSRHSTLQNLGRSLDRSLRGTDQADARAHPAWRKHSFQGPILDRAADRARADERTDHRKR